MPPYEHVSLISITMTCIHMCVLLLMCTTCVTQGQEHSLSDPKLFDYFEGNTYGEVKRQTIDTIDLTREEAKQRQNIQEINDVACKGIENKKSNHWPSHLQKWDVYGDISELYRECPHGFQPCSDSCRCCDCSLCGFHKIPQFLSKDVVCLDFFQNYISELAPDIFIRFSSLRFLYLPHNYLTRLNNGSFAGLEQLKTLNLVGNHIRMQADTIPVESFRFLKNLTTLAFHRNNIKTSGLSLNYPDQAFSGLENLQNLTIDGLTRKTFGPGFLQMTSLSHLSLPGYNTGYCKLLEISNETFRNMPYLKSLNISDCSIQGDELDKHAFASLQQLQVLDLSYNEAIGLDALNMSLCHLVNSSLRELYIGNIVSRYSFAINVEVKHVMCMPKHLRVLVAVGNSFQSVHQDVFEHLPPQLEVLDVSGNEFVFESYLQFMWKMRSLRTLKLNGEEYLHDLPSHYPYQAPYKTATISKSKIQNAIDDQSAQSENGQGVSRKAITFKLPRTLEHIEMSNAGLRYKLSKLIFVKENNLRSIKINWNMFPFLRGPLVGLDRLQILDLSYSNVRCIQPDFFDSFPSLEILDLSYNVLGRYNYCKSMQNQLFDKLSSLAVLNLGYNDIKKITLNQFSGLTHLRTLILRINTFWEFKANISHMKYLEHLDLHGTSIHTLSPYMRTQIDAIRNITVDLSWTPIYCLCPNLEFLQWMTSPSNKAFKNDFRNDFIGYKCVFEDQHDKIITDGYREDLRILSRKCMPPKSLFAAVLSASIVVFMLLLAAIVYRFRWNLRFFYYAAYQKYWNRAPMSEGEEFEYDVFLSYSSSDETFVLQTLEPALRSRDVKVLIHGRDFRAGDHIASNIVSAVKISRRTLVVLTASQVNSHWCTYEVQMANVESAYSGRQVLVFLLMETIPKNKVGTELLTHIKTNTYTSYPPAAHRSSGDVMNIFWNKLATDLKG